MSEKDLQDLIVDFLIRNHCLVMRINQGRRGRLAFSRWKHSSLDKSKTSGIADILALTPTGLFIAIDPKSEYNTLSDDQKKFLQIVRFACNAYTIVPYDFDEFEREYRRIITKGRER